MIYRFHPQQFSIIDPEQETVTKFNLTPVYTLPCNIKIQRHLYTQDHKHVFEYVKGSTLETYFNNGVHSVIISLLFDLMQKTFIYHDNQWFSWLDDYNPSNFILDGEGELVVIDWLEAQWFKVEPSWCINQMRKLCGLTTGSDIFACSIIEKQLEFFLEDNFKELLPFLYECTDTDLQIIPMRSVWLYPELESFRHPAFVECQQYRILNNLENDTTVHLGPFDTVEIQDQVWYNLIRQYLI